MVPHPRLRGLLTMMMLCCAVLPAAAFAATVSSDKADYAPGETVTLTGTGWQPGETVLLLLHREPMVSPDITLSPVADGGGNISATHVIGEFDLGVTYTMTATGANSGLTAMTTFTDAPAAGTAPVNPPTGGFAIDGNLGANVTVAGIGDWVPGVAGSGGNVLTAAGAPIEPGTTFHATDLYNSGVDNNFAGGNKFDGNPNTEWTWVANPVNDKQDMNNGLIHFTTDSNGHDWVMVAADRLSNNGDAYIDFEFLQNTLSVTGGPSGGGFSSAGPNGGRTLNDFVLTLELTRGGTAANFFVSRWEAVPVSAQAPDGFDYVDRTGLVPGSAVLAAVNNSVVPVSFGAFGGTTYDVNTFVESGIDLTALLGAIDKCTSLGVKSILIKTKESQSPTATIVDFIAPLQLDRRIGLADAGPNQNKCTNVFTLAGSATPAPGDAISSTTWTVVGGAATIVPTNSLTPTVTVTGSPATLRLTVTTTFGCSVTDDVVLTVDPAPACSVDGPPGPVCPGASDLSFSAPAGMASYLWTITGNGTINGSAIGQTVSVTAGSACNSSFTLSLAVTNAGGCNSTCGTTVNVNDTQAPTVASCPTDQTIECTATPSFGSPSFSDNCDTDLTVTFADVTTAGNCANAFDVTRTWTAKDNCNNAITCSQTIHVVDTTKPVFANVPADANVSCDNIPPVPTVTASDACDPEVVPVLAEGIVILDSVTPPPTTCSYQIVRTWTATDDCGNTATATQTLTVTDTQAPTVASCPTDQTIECTATPSFGSPNFSDNCDTDLTVTFADVTTAGNCANAFDVTRTWTAKDNCNNAVTCSQTIHVVDTTKPVFANVPADANVSCDNIPPVPTTVTASDACDPDVVPVLAEGIVILDSVTPPPTTCSYQIVRTWTATDDCGNTATATQTLTVTDTQAPTVASCPADQTIECTATPSFGSPSFSDNCDTDLTVTFADVTTAGNCANAFDVTRTWTAKDNCNNAVTCSQTIHVVDTTKPVFANVPADANVSCDNIPPVPTTVTASDACDPDVVPVLAEGIVILDSVTPPPTTCSYQIVRTWTATDDCGNTATATQTLTVIDTTNPTVVSCPTDQTIECSVTPSFGSPNFSDNCDTDLTVTFADVTTAGNCANAFDVTRTWTAKDNCNNAITCSQTIHVVDTTKPVFANVPADANVSCDNIPPVPTTVTASDACDPDVVPVLAEGIVILDSVTPPPTTCSYQIVRTWTATDDCGNTATATQTLNVVDTTNPTVASCPADQTIECTATPSFGSPSFNDNCDTDLTVTFADVTTAGNCANAHDVTRTWTAKDNCNNAITCSQTIHVVDTKAPVLACPADITVGECNNTVTYDTTAPDACGGAVTIVFNPPSGSVFSVGTTTVHVTATDACNNASSCDFKVNVTGSPVATITGEDAVCAGQTAQLCGPDGSFSWTWTGPGGYTAGTRCITVGVAGTYNLIVTNTVNGCSTNGSHELTVNDKPVSSISGPTETCAGTTVQLCGPDGNFGYAWTGPAGYTADTRCITVGTAGDYSLTITDLATKCASAPRSQHLTLNNCVANCPRTPGFWAAQCDQAPTGQTKFDAPAMTSISERVDSKVGIFNWSNGTDFSRFCSTVSTGGSMDQRRQAKRQFAAFLANVCTGELGLIANNGDAIFLNLNSPVSCSALSATTMGGLITEVDNLLLSLEGQSLTNPTVKAKYSQIISCLNAINNAEGVGTVCQSAQQQNALYQDFESTAGLSYDGDVVELYRPSPNPFSGSTRIAYVVRGTGENVQIGVFDIAGRHMRTLASGFQSPGRYELSWDGSTDNGVRANNGVYFVRSVVAGQVQTMRVIYVK